MAELAAAPTFRHAYHAVHLTKSPARALLWRILAEHLERYVPDDGEVVELGAGYCYWINSVRARRRVAVDLWEELPKHAAPGVKPLLHDITSGLGILGNSQFDVALASNLLEHFDPDAASRLVAEIYQVLRGGGRFIVIQPNFRHAYRQYFDDYTHRTIFTDVSLGNLLRSHGFELELMRPKFLPYSLRGRDAMVRPWLIRAYLRSPVKPFAGQMLAIARKP